MSGRQANGLLALVLILVAALVLLSALGSLPAGIADWINRGWPALLVLLGIGALLRGRVRFGGLLALVLTGLLVGGLGAVAYNSRLPQYREDYREPIQIAVGEEVTLLRVQVTTLSTDVELVRSLQARTISGSFVGSTESRLEVRYETQDAGAADLRVVETQPNPFPLLEALGRGRLQIELPADVPLDIAFSGGDGATILNLTGLALERLNLDVLQGDVTISLPDYQPRAAGPEASLGGFVVRDGAVVIRVPSGVAARFELNRGSSGLEPLFDALDYNYLVGDILEARAFDSAAVRLRYSITAPRGQITIETATS